MVNCRAGIHADDEKIHDREDGNGKLTGNACEYVFVANPAHVKKAAEAAFSDPNRLLWLS